MSRHSLLRNERRLLLSTRKNLGEVVFRLQLLRLGVASLLCSLAALSGVDAGVGVNYETVANNLRTSIEVNLALLKTTTITRVKLYNADPSFLTAFMGSGFALVVGVSGPCLDGIELVFKGSGSFSDPLLVLPQLISYPSCGEFTSRLELRGSEVINLRSPWRLYVVQIPFNSSIVVVT